MMEITALSEVAVLVFVIVGCVALLVRVPKKEQGICWACGQPGANLHWRVIDEDRAVGPLVNQRVSYLIHLQCIVLAEKQAGF
jgi:hypothetical protein